MNYIKRPVILKREPNTHKGTYGTALLVCGSYGMAGALVMSAKGCLRSGIGLAKCVVDEKIYPIVASLLPEAVFAVTDQNDILSRIESELKTANCVLFGCGVGQSRQTEQTLEFIIKNAKIPIIIDADGINALALGINILRQAKTPLILTPHPKEMSRLTGKTVEEIEKDRIGTATEFSKRYQVYTVLKGHNTVVATPTGEHFINPTGNAGMATGGSGDVLAGIMAARICQNTDIISAVTESVYIHGLAGDIAAERKSQTAMLPSDIIEELPCVYKILEG